MIWLDGTSTIVGYLMPSPFFIHIDNSIPKVQFKIFGLFGFYGISTFGGNLILDPFLDKLTVLFQTIHLSITHFGSI